MSRLLGFIRDLLVAFLLGSSIFADAFFVAFRIPNLLRSFLAEGALTAAFTPVFASSCTKGKEAAQLTFSNIAGLLLALTLPIVVALIFFAPQIVSVFAPGFTADASTYELCVTLTQIMAPYILFVSFIAMINSALNTLGVFGTSALAQVIMNSVLIIGGLCALLVENNQAITYILAISVIVGGVAQIVSQLPACRRNGLSIAPKFIGGKKVQGEVLGLMLPAILGASVYQITIFFGTLLASLLPSGSVSWLFYADRIAQFPMGIFSIALASVLLPTLANAAASSDQDSFNLNLRNSLRYTSFCIIPVSVLIVYFAYPIVELLFERGEFTQYASIQTARALQALGIGLWAASCHSMIIRAFIAKKNTVIPTCIGVCTLAVTILVALLLVGPLPMDPSSNLLVTGLSRLQTVLYEMVPISYSLGHIGLAMASSIAAFFSMSLAVLILSAFFQKFSWLPVLRATATSLASALGAVLILSQLPLATHIPIIQLIVGGIVGLVSYLGFACLLRSREARELQGAIFTQLRKIQR